MTIGLILRHHIAIFGFKKNLLVNCHQKREEIYLQLKYQNAKRENKCLF